MSDIAFPLHHSVDAVLPAGKPRELTIAPGQEDLARIAEAYGLLGLRDLVADLTLYPFRRDGVRVRVGNEWRRYEVGRTMVFDDSFEHEVIHGGEADRFVLYTVLHHPELGTPQMVGEAEACGAGDLD